MAFSLTIDGYTFDNPPSSYRKRIDLGNSPQPHYEKTATPFYRSDSQQITLELSGRLNLNDQGDLDELEKLQAKAIDGGEVDVQFDPFFSGRGVIEDDPFDQENQVGTYSFTIAINEEYTDDSAYPAHATPTTGNTFELGDFDFGFDPSTVSQEYERQTERVDRLGGVAHTADTKGLVTRVSLEGRVDGGGQAELWDKARSNALAYLSAEFQNGWALLNSLSVQKDDATPDYLQGLFRYSSEFLIVKDPSSGIGEVSQFINHDVGDSGTYTSDDDSGSGSDEGGLDFKVLGGTGSIGGRYVDWVTTTLTLDDDTTNYVFVDDSDQDGVGQVEYNTSGFPGSDALPLYEVDTSNGEIVDVRDVRDSLLGSGDDTTSDLLFEEEFAIDDTAFSYAQILAFSDAVGDPALVQDYLGRANLSETVPDPVEGPLDALGRTSYRETISFDDGGSALTGVLGSEANTYGSASDWDNSASESGVVHESFGDLPGDEVVQLGYPSFDRGGNALEAYLPMDDDSSPATDVTGNGYDGDVYGGTFGVTGLHNTMAIRLPNVTDRIEVPDTSTFSNLSEVTIMFWITIKDWGNSYNITHDWFTGSDHVMTLQGSNNGGEPYKWIFSTTNDGTNIEVDVWSNPSNDIDVRRFVAVSYTGSEVTTYLDGSPQNSTSVSGELYDSPDPISIGDRNGGGGYGPPDMVIEDYQLLTRGLSDAEIQAAYEAGKDGSITTPWKTFSGPGDPTSLTLENVAATLNSETITVYVESDSDADGNVEQTSDAITLDGSGGPYSVTGISESSSKFRLRVEISTSDITVSPTFDGADLSATIFGGGDSDQNPNTTWKIDPAIYDRSGNEYEGGGAVSKYGG